MAKLHKMGAPNSAFSMGAPPIAGSTPTYNAIYLGLTPGFWRWVHDGRGVDLTHSLFYLSACDADQNPSLAVNIGARAFFAYNVDVSDQLANAVALYLFTMLAKKSFTPEEAYYNMLLIDETATPCTPPTTFQRGLRSPNSEYWPNRRPGERPKKGPGKKRGRNRTSPSPIFTTCWTLTALKPTGTRSLTSGSGWLSDNVAGGAIFYLLVAARAPSLGGTIKQGLRNSSICWDAWWSKGKLGGISTTCASRLLLAMPPTGTNTGTPATCSPASIRATVTSTSLVSRSMTGLDGDRPARWRSARPRSALRSPF